MNGGVLQPVIHQSLNATVAYFRLASTVLQRYARLLYRLIKLCSQAERRSFSIMAINSIIVITAEWKYEEHR